MEMSTGAAKPSNIRNISDSYPQAWAPPHVDLYLPPAGKKVNRVTKLGGFANDLSGPNDTS